MTRLFHIFCIAAMTLSLLTACSSDTASPDEVLLPARRYPLIIESVTQSRDNPVRVTDDGVNCAWADGDRIMVMVLDGGNEIITYCTLSADGQVTDYNPQPFWTTNQDSDVLAWYSNVEDNDMTIDYENAVSIQNQSERLAYIMEQTTTGKYSAALQLTLSHKLSKIVVCLEDFSDDVTEVAVKGYTQFTNTPGGAVAGTGEKGWIKMHPSTDHQTWTANVVPEENVPGEYIVKITYSGGATREYTASCPVGSFQAGKAYTFTIYRSQFALDAIKPGDFVYTDGTFSDGGLRMVYADGRVTYDNNATPLAGKTCAGIVFHIRKQDSPADICEYEAFTGSPTGYIVSLDSNTSAWSEQSPHAEDDTYPNSAYINGYKYTKEFGIKHSDKGLIAIPWCTRHTKITDSQAIRFSTWYMPSQQEYILMRGNNIKSETPPLLDFLNFLDVNLTKAQGEKFRKGWHTTSGLMGSYGEYLFTYDLHKGNTENFYENRYLITTTHYRAVCAFKTSP